jgi:alpha-N-arabinofuranosidase
MAEMRKKNGRERPWNVRFWGIGNESWGCGGNMTAEFYADNYRRYAVYARNYGPSKLYKIACGPSDTNYDWTRTLMEKTRSPAGPLLNGLSLHYYTVPGDWAGKGSATDFNEGDWFVTMRKAYVTAELLRKHGDIMDEYDPERKVGLVMDEWGTWYDVEPGTNPGFLYQQNSLRDALVAGIHFNIFNNNAERLFMANIAQTINVLQSLILTEGPRMVLTPTYHAFDMYKVHQDAVMLPVHVESETIGTGLPLISASASLDDRDKIHLSLTNIDPANEREIRVELRGLTVSPSLSISGTVINSGRIQDCNTFEDGAKVSIAEFTGAAVSGTALHVVLLPHSLVTLELG